MRKKIVTPIIFLILVLSFSGHVLASTSTVISGMWQFDLYEYTNGSTMTVFDKSFNLSQISGNSFSNFVGTIKDDKVHFLYLDATSEVGLYWQSSNQTLGPYFYGNFPFLTGTVISLVGNIINSDHMKGSWIGIFNGQTEMGTWQAVRLTHEQVAQQVLCSLGGLALIVLAIAVIWFIS